MTQQDHVAVRTLESGPAVLAVHGGGGPESMRQIVEGLSVDHEVLLPTHPGWAGQPRDPAIRSVPDLAQRCLRLLLGSDLSDVTVVASSFGGWVAAELALLAPRGVIGRMVLLNPVGPAPTQPEMAHRRPPQTPEAVNPSLDLVRSYTGPAMCSPDLSERLSAIEQPILVVWGADDPVLPLAYGQRMAGDLGDATCVAVPGAGHLPHEDAPEQTLAVIRGFLDSTRVARVTR
jgi:pimeloyl-ACP methyl ester carboxylesterase